MNIELTARDLMRTDFKTLSPEATMKDAARLLQAAEEDGLGAMPAADALLVINEDGSLAGVVSMFGILRAVTPEFMQESPHLVVATWEGLFDESIQDKATARIKDIMAIDVVTVRDDARLIPVMLAMVNGHVSRVAVIDAERKAVGVVGLTRVFREVARKFAKME